MLLTLDRVSAAYGRSQVLWDVDLAVPDGGALALVGRNGVGKTTLLKTIVGIKKSISGRISFGGTEITTAAPHLRARAGIGFVPQGRHVFPQLTVAENIATGLAALDGRPDPSRRVPDYVFDMFPKLATIASRKAGLLSGGEQQQLAIGRALAGQPKLLLLDEPTEGIQPNIVQQIEEALRRIRDQLGVTIVIVEQYLDFAWGFADRFAVMQRGQIIREGSTSEEKADDVAHLVNI
ncbi:MAG TPA: urea ABC transporter ATP-binding subunit UrtE [Acidiphilium sp.]|jgi:urea transport system ATP-binding protein|uniref:urea ABC transporter ATP-binding subunit UrtE n=1 Tax=unclassified Acidiphilium TaxID=2617493 RepID=UPI000BCAA691|nr:MULTISPECIES: urea ABC transporter ATP-binding subunit UrtE [unclassified Acidiphilium]OYV55088.1 MAG: urea ABC transporter ATP-binding subunit UrtE [Acidiphilium sp. 20-67-58]HQT60224.1 urea ABC transporter ATP-binding subunit UrtE [Acidiphilium sp.]HQU11801.1 urea ABC transporter ATP-binding subunit UrtE [Acidiphilium sp.]